MERRKFTREFKLEAVRLIKDRGVSYVQASQDLGVHTSQLRDWVKKLADDPQHAFPGQGQMKPEQLEIARLKREVTKLKAERDILKKAVVYFAKESTGSSVSLRSTGGSGRRIGECSKCIRSPQTSLHARPCSVLSGPAFVRQFLKKELANRLRLIPEVQKMIESDKNPDSSGGPQFV